MKRVVVIGHGRMGRNHARVLRQLGHQVITVDPDPAAGADHELLGIVTRSGIDTACVAVPIPELADVAERCLHLGMNVLVEKPGATSVDQLLDLHALADRNGRRLFVGYTERHNAVVKRLRDCMFLVGTVRHVSTRRLGRSRDVVLDPDVALDLAVHDLDVLDALGIRFDLNWSLGVPMDPQRHVSLLMTEAQGKFSISVEASHLHPHKIRQIEVVGDNGCLLADYAAQRLHCWSAEDESDGDLLVDGVEPLVAEWQAFFNGARSDGLAAMRVAEEIAGYVAPELAVVK